MSKVGIILLDGAIEKSVDGEGEIIRGTFYTTGGDTGCFRIGNKVYDESGKYIGEWVGEPS